MRAYVILNFEGMPLLVLVEDRARVESLILCN